MSTGGAFILATDTGPEDELLNGGEHMTDSTAHSRTNTSTSGGAVFAIIFVLLFIVVIVIALVANFTKRGIWQHPHAPLFSVSI